MAAMTARCCATAFRCAAVLRPLWGFHPTTIPRAAAGLGVSSSSFSAAAALSRAAAPGVCAAAAATAAPAKSVGGREKARLSVLPCRSIKSPPPAARGVMMSPQPSSAAATQTVANESPSPSSALLLRRCFAAAAAKPSENHLLLTLSSPSEAIYIRTPVQSVTVPGSEGALTLTNGHSQMVSRLKSGEIIVRRDAAAGGDSAADRFFVSDGFLLFNSPDDDSGCCTAEVLGIELVPVHVLDKEKAVAALQTLLQQGAGAVDAWTKARTLLGQSSAVIEQLSSRLLSLSSRPAAAV